MLIMEWRVYGIRKGKRCSRVTQYRLGFFVSNRDNIEIEFELKCEWNILTISAETVRSSFFIDCKNISYTFQEIASFNYNYFTY